MFIAHTPVGYLIGSSLLRRVKILPLSATMVIWSCIIGSIAPDLDMLYFYFIDNRQTHHHKYFSHWPALWLALLMLSIVWFALRRSSKAALALTLFSICGLVHMIMDTVVGDIWWLAPFVDKPFAFFTVESRFKPWWLNFVLHWSFALELLLLSWAILRYRRRTNKSLNTDPSGRLA